MDGSPESALTPAARIAAILREAAGLMAVLRLARAAAPPDWLVFSGAVYQPVWNHLTGRPPDYGLKDYDLGYYDGADLSWEAEDAVIRRVAAAATPALAKLVEVRNQARVHIWFEARFGEPYDPLRNTAEALSRFVAPAFAIGARLRADDTLDLVAPFGFDDLLAMRLRPNPARPTPKFNQIAASVAARWPELTIEA